MALACAASALRWIGPGPALRIYGGSGVPLATISVPAGFTLSFIHSINLSPVDEAFSAGTDGYVTLERMLFDQMSTGMPSGDEDGFAVVGGRFCTTPYRRLREIAVRVSPIPGHDLRAGGRVRPLTRWAPAGGLLVMRAVARPGGVVPRKL
ncbi:MAG: DUF1850 domain-containing protein, partial [Spirochaetes bacterium]|nr:DUF1850 domain-containing protein [Spirochaetota bacterium]